MPHDAVPARALPPVLRISSDQWAPAIRRLVTSDRTDARRWIRDAMWELRCELGRLRLQERRLSNVAACVVEFRAARRIFVERRLLDLKVIGTNMTTIAGEHERGRHKGGAAAVAKARMKSEGGSDKFIRAQAGWAT